MSKEGYAYVNRLFGTSKETYQHIQMKRDVQTCQKRPTNTYTHEKRCEDRSKEAYTHRKRLREMSKETYKQSKRPTNSQKRPTNSKKKPRNTSPFPVRSFSPSLLPFLLSFALSLKSDV